MLAVGGAMLYFMRSFKPALARDYDVFFAAIGLLCGGILFFQGWRLDPILQFGQFLLAGTTVFFAYESVRLRGVATEQARRSAYFDDESPPIQSRESMGGLRGGWEDDYDRFDEPPQMRRRFNSSEDFRQEKPRDDFYKPRRPSRAAIPEEAASRRPLGIREKRQDWNKSEEDEQTRRMSRFRAGEENNVTKEGFGDRRSKRQTEKRGSRPSARNNFAADSKIKPQLQQDIHRDSKAEDAAFTPRNETNSRPQRNRPTPRSSRPRDNNSRFDD